MSEFEPKNPEHELRERAQKIIDRLNDSQDATRAKICEATAEGRADAWAMHDAVAERIAEDSDAQERRAREKIRCQACLDAITAKLAAQDIFLSRDTQSVLLLVMEQITGEWREYDGDEVSLGTVTVDEHMITISFVSYGFEVGRKTLPLPFV